MLGIIVILLVSWLIVYVLGRENLNVLGFSPIGKRIIQFLLGFVIAAFLCFSAQLLELVLSSSTWEVNEKFNLPLFSKSLWFDLKSVITEELVFRGILLYILLKKLAKTWAVLFSAAAFGVYHWFSYGVFGNPMAMLFVFLGTGLMGYVLALSFVKSKSILVPIGIHLGWNFTYNTLFSKGPLGETFIISTGGQTLTDWVSLFNFLYL